MDEMRSIEITTRIGCSNMCKFCPQALLIGQYHKRSKEIVLSLQNYKRFLKKVPKSVKIEFSGMVEPWLNEDCTRMLLYAYKQGYKRIGVFTTTMGMSLEDFEKIKDIPFTVFYVHLADAEGNTNIKVDRNYLKLLRVIKKSKIKNKRYMAMGKLHPKLVSLFGNSLEKITMQTRAGNLDFLPQVYKKGPIKCSWKEGIKHNLLLPNGDVVLCCVDFGIKHVLGNLFYDSYDDLFKGREFKKIVKALKNESKGEVICRHCEFATEDTCPIIEKSIYRKMLDYFHLTGQKSRIKSFLKFPRQV